MTNDEAVWAAANELQSRLRIDRAVVERVAEAIIAKLSRLEQSRVERAVEVARSLARMTVPEGDADIRPSYVRQEAERIVAILTAQDSSAGSAVESPASTGSTTASCPTVPEAAEPGGRSSPDPTSAVLAGMPAHWCHIDAAKSCPACTWLARRSPQPSPPPAEVKPSVRFSRALLDEMRRRKLELGEGKTAALYEALCRFFDDQHARGRK